MKEQNFPAIVFTVEKNNASLFFSILQHGVVISATIGCSIKSLLCDQFDITPEYLSDRISTIFLNGKPVDDVESAIIKADSILALSGAMPGLVGATFRKGGALSIFRSSISHKNENISADAPVKGMITLKLFNLLVSEMGPAFLKRGCRVTTGLLCDLMENKKEDLTTGLKSIVFNGEEIGMDGLVDLIKKDEQELIHITVFS